MSHEKMKFAQDIVKIVHRSPHGWGTSQGNFTTTERKLLELNIDMYFGICFDNTYRTETEPKWIIFFNQETLLLCSVTGTQEGQPTSPQNTERFTDEVMDEDETSDTKMTTGQGLLFRTRETSENLGLQVNRNLPQ